MRRASAAAVLAVTCLLLPASPASAGQAKGTLTIDTESPDIWFSVNVTSAAVPAAATLADSAGQHVADVAVTAGACPASRGAEQRDIGLTGSTWCVHVSGLQVGYAVSGTIASPGTSLALTVKRKGTPGFPLLWSIVALLAAALISFLSRTYVPSLTSQLRRRRYERDGGIAGLGDWVKLAAANGVLADDDIVARAQWARKYGQKQVLVMRARLARALADPGLAVPRESPLWQACHAESARPATDVTREDVLTNEGARSTKAAALLDSLTKASTAIHDFKSSADEIIGTLADPGQAQQATRTRDNALSAASNLSAEMVPQFVTTLADVILAMRNTFQAQHLELRAAGRLAAAATSVSAAHVTVTDVATSVKAAFAPVVVYIPAVLLAFVVMAGAVATVFAAQYLANPTFGTPADYWTLILTAYGSAQAAAIAAALLLVRSPKPWYG